jgi:hypothetical protein
MPARQQKAEQRLAEWQTATEVLIRAAERRKGVHRSQGSPLGKTEAEAGRMKDPH